MSSSAKNAVATCFTPAETIPPLAATAAASVGSSALEKTSSCSIVSMPSVINPRTLPAVSAVTTSAPAMET